jgi:hypothetical protein
MIRTVDQFSGQVSILAGHIDPGFRDGVGSSASFHNPSSIAISSDFVVYVGDYLNGLIRTINASTVATVAGSLGRAGSTDGWGLSASFNLPSGLAADGFGNLYISDNYNNLLRYASFSISKLTLYKENEFVFVRFNYCWLIVGSLRRRSIEQLV